MLIDYSCFRLCVILLEENTKRDCGSCERSDKSSWGVGCGSLHHRVGRNWGPCPKYSEECVVKELLESV